MHPKQHTKCTSQAEQESILGHFLGDLEVGVVDLVLLDRILRATSNKKGRQLFKTFSRKKVHPQTKSWLCLCAKLSPKALSETCLVPVTGHC